MQVTGTGDAGGLVGGAANSSSVITNSYSTGAVTGSGTRINGLQGNLNGSTVTNSYWDTVTSGKANSGDSGGGVGKTTSELQSPIDYTGIYSTWDDDDIDGDGETDSPWNFGTTSEYPTLPTLFTLDLDKSGTFVPRQDLLGTYQYLAEGISRTDLMTYTHNRDQDTANKMAELIDESITGAAPPLDLDGNGTVSARLDILGAYLYTAERISITHLRLYTHNRDQNTVNNQNTANTMAGTIDALIE